jgi:Flp pilus assembly pilin Flp
MGVKMRSTAANWPNLRILLAQFRADTGAATAIEYAIIAAGVGATVAGAIYGLGTTIQDTLYNKINSVIQ